MAKRIVAKKPTPSAVRKRKAQQRIRKKIRAKRERQRPQWSAAVSRTYGAGNKKGSGKKEFGRKKRSREDADGEENEGEDIGDEAEVQSDVSEDRMERMNKRDPLETQLFLKNLPLDITEKDITDYFARFGTVRRVLLVRNKISKRPTGTAFVHCGDLKLADAIVEHAQTNAREMSAAGREEAKGKTEGMSHHRAKQLMYKMNASPFLAREPFIMLLNTRVTVLRVLSRVDSIEVVSQAKKKAKRTKVAGDDPRNLYLLMEGHLPGDSPATKGLHPRYIQMIQDDFERRKEQLKNSNYFVSTVRLSFRNLPRVMPEKELKTLCLDVVRKYLKENPEDAMEDKWGKHGPIKHIKILQDSAGVSRGYGFVEFLNHNVALHVLRALNNNPTIFGDQRRLMVSFSIEDINAIQKLERIREKRREMLASGQGYPRSGDAYYSEDV